ncbi:DEAD/DEAH box helicase family protein [Idiomarina sp.]|uniref:DEAD/DEAH box helicase family protein n=1 Tax=Idiomarina sp. TaxID=1874361 RepID=UPI0025BCC149|nr:DEAD/DEAH box helicase family protein [Idiomarina sp.]
MTTTKKRLEKLSPVFFPSEKNIVSSLFLPVAECSTSFDCLSAYFSSRVLAELAEPLSTLYQNPQSKGRFLIGPSLSDEDKEALLQAYDEDKSIYKYLIGDIDITKNTVAECTLDVMKYLIWTERLDIRLVLMRQGIMHAKIWLFDTLSGKVAIHGSGNATKSGLMSNFEQLVLNREWESDSSNKIVEAYQSRFNSFWEDERPDSYTLCLNDKTISDVMGSTRLQVSESELPKLMDRLRKKLEEKMDRKKLKVPNWLVYRDGDFKHQGEAVDSWFSAGKRGTLEIATGGGKTLTSLVCATLALEKELSALLIVSVPNKPLIKQWAEDVRNFSIEPISTEGLGTKNITRTIRQLIKEHDVLPQQSVIILTHDALKTPEIKDVLSKYKNKMMLIGDEAHNLGTASFADDPPEFIDFRLALSATPERQYDQDGTDKLFQYFGPIVYRFPLEEAIGNCLVPFQYVAHKVYLNQEEAALWREYTEKINRLSWSDDKETKKIVEQLQIRRRAISESAKGKISAFQNEAKNLKDRVHSLAFCTDKGPEQLIDVNEVLRRTRFIFHQITGEETSNKKLMDDLVRSYKVGDIEILTSKKVLDEGFNIPPIKTAFFLASSGTKRTWVQRLGRVLRKSESTGKTKAIIHDFIVFPPENRSDYNALVSSELSRIQWFMSLALKDKSLNSAINISNELISVKESL